MTFAALRSFLDTLLHVERFAAVDDLNGVFLPAAQPDAPLCCLGLALEPTPDWSAWVERERLDAVFLHRPWSLGQDVRRALAASGVGVLAYHLAFDEHLTTGFNPELAAACGWGEPELLAEKEGRPLGMTCALRPDTPVSYAEIIARLEGELGGLEQVTMPESGSDTTLTRVACVGAMNDRLVRAAHAAGTGLYVTGQWRQPARRAVRETGLGVAAVGHRRSELWGLRKLGRLLRDHLATSDVKVVEWM